MAKTHQYKAGDKLRRIGKGWEGVEVGDEVEVSEAFDASVTLVGHGSLRFDPAQFEIVERKPLPKAPIKPTAFNIGKVDPNNIDQHAPGAKLDHGKPRHGLVLGAFSNALTEVAKVGTFGANKYTDNGWLSVPNGLERYTDALLRHHFAEAGGERNDPESELSHAAHRAWNALAVLELALRKKEDK